MTGFDNYEKMFAQSIGLTEPWRIERAEFNEDKREVHIYVSARKTAKYPCPKCGKMCQRYDDEETERTWRHGDVVFFPCYVHCRRPRIRCGKEIHVVTAPWARAGSRYTLLFESYAMLLVRSMTVNEARKMLRISNTSLTGILRYWVKKAVNEMYFRLFKDNTGTFVDALLCLNCGLWYPGFELTLYPDGTKGYWPVTCYEPAVMNSLIEPVKQYHQNIEASIFARKWSISSYLVSPGSFFWLFLTFFGYIIEKKKIKYLPLFLFSIMYFATFLLGPVSLVRYVIFLYILVPIYLTIYSS